MNSTGKRAFRLTAAATAAAVLTGLLTGSIDLPEAPLAGPADVPFVQGLEVDPAVLDRDINQELAGAATANLPAPVWPSTSSARIELASDQRLAVPESPISLVGNASDQVKSIQVNTLGRSDSDARGFTGGLVFELTRTDGGGTGEVSAQVDYAAFAYAFGADWRTRLALWTIPECEGCAPERLDTSNDIAHGTATADVPLDGTETTMLLLAADAKGGAGDYTATKLSPSSTWSQGGNSGSYNWSYPMNVPSPVGAGPLPSLGLSYSSASVDGRSEATNNQPGWIGEGFSFGSGSIERRYVPCANDMDDGNNTEKTGDRCWKTDNAILSMEGRGGELVRDDGSGKWRLKNDDGTVIERKTDTVNPDNNHEYWKLTTPDGTQYFFGLNRLPGWSSDKSTTESVLTVPVAGNHTDEPCHDSTFGASFCDQAWKWSLDYVVDVHGNTMSYWYDVDTNRYGKASKADNPVLYDRAGELVRIDYGTDNRDGTEYGGIVPGRIDFTLTDRCLADCGTHDEAHWPDTPWDLSCTSTTSCPESLSPSFWSTKRLTKITTTVWDNGLGKHVPVDSWEMTHSFPNPGDGTRAGLWLDSIIRTGHVGGTAAMPSIEFDWVQMYNRVDVGDGEPTMNWMRMAAIWTETGGLISMTYTPRDCVHGSNMPASPSSNDKRCYPVLSQDPYDEDVLNTDWFHKYLVTSISQYDQLEGLNTVTTKYEYVGKPAWRYAEPDALVEDKYRTWADFRGYSTVKTRTGPDADASLTETKYFRGMNGDRLSGGGSREVTVSASIGPDIIDDNLYAGMVRESTVYNGVDTAYVSRTVNEPWKSAHTAKRVIDGDTTYARYIRGDEVTYAQRYLTTSNTWQTSKTTKYYDDTYGAVDKVIDHGDIAVTGDEKCALTEYNRNTAKNLLFLVSRSRSYAGPCPAAGSSGTPATVLSDTRTSFDGLAYGVAPTKGMTTRTEELKNLDESTTPAIPIYLTTADLAYDASGRLKESTDVKLNKSTTAYTPTTGGPVTKTIGTNHLGWTTTTTKNLRGDPLLTTDVNGKTTELAYDPLGRLSKAWTTTLRGRTNYKDFPAKEFTYTLSKDGKNYVTTKTMDAATGVIGGHYQVSYELYDGLLRLRQTQSLSPGSTGGRIITDTLYDYHGRAYATQGPFRAAGTPSGTLYQTEAGEIFTHSLTEYDRADRPTAVITYRQHDELWRTTTSYTGDSTTVIPADGGIPTTTITDIDGKTTELRQHLTSDASGATHSLHYTYNSKDQLTAVSDAPTGTGNTWTYTYDIRGRQTSVDDPDSGLSTVEYNDAGEKIATTDARGKRLTIGYDSLGRKTSLSHDFDGQGPEAPKMLAQWRYDTLISGATWNGQAAGWSRFDTAGNEYRFDVRQITAEYLVTSSQYTIPAVEGQLAGTYVYGQTYTTNGSPASFTYPTAGNLPGETINSTYNTTTGLPEKITGGLQNLGYVTGTTYSAYGELESSTYSNNSFFSKRTNWYDEATRRLTRTVVGDETNPVTDTNYTHNDVGTITRIEEDVKNDTQCFTYDRLQRLTEAWTPSSGACGDARDADALGGPAPYWKSYSHDDTGNRTSLIDNTTGATTTYKQTDTAHPHAVTSASTSTATTTDTPFVRNFQYDDAGNMKARTGATGTEQSLTWDVEGRLATITDLAGSSTNTYGADGERLIRRDPKGATLYLPGQEIRYDTATNSRSCARYYTHAGSVFAIRTTSGGLQWLFNDHQGTASVAINQGNPQVVTYRYQDPYGNPRGTNVVWPGERGFQNGVNDPSGLTHIGAREYDGSLGRFISDDPVVMTQNRQQLHGYAYAGNSPLSFADPSGLAQDPDMPQGTYATEAWVNSDSYHPPSYYAPPPPAEPEGDDCWGWSWTCDAIDSADKWMTDNAAIVGAGVGILAGAMCMSIATGATFGVGAAPAAVGCGALAGAIGSAVTSNLEGDSAEETVTDALTGAVLGGALGFLGPLAGAAKNGLKALPGAIKALPGAIKGLPGKLIPNSSAKAAPPLGDDATEVFYHGTSKDFAEDIVANGIDRQSSLNNTVDSIVPGDFFAVSATKFGPNDAGNMALRFATRQADEGCRAIVVCDLPVSLVSQLEKSGLLIRGATFPGEAQFKPGAFPLINPFLKGWIGPW